MTRQNTKSNVTESEDKERLTFSEAFGFLGADFPEKGDSLFASALSRDPTLNACVGNWPVDRRGIYAHGFRLGGDVIAMHLLQTKSGLDTAIYPMVFCYRHYMELRMKEILRDGWDLLDVELVVPMEHRLDKLWILCRKIACQVWPDGDRSPLKAMDALVQELAEADPESFDFRYPTSKNGKATLEKYTHINVAQVVEGVSKMACLLDSLSMGIAQYLSNRREMESVY